MSENIFPLQPVDEEDIKNINDVIEQNQITNNGLTEIRNLILNFNAKGRVFSYQTPNLPVEGMAWFIKS